MRSAGPPSWIRRQKYASAALLSMDDASVADRLRDLYGLNPDIPHMAFQFPRLPPMARRGLAGSAGAMPDRMGTAGEIARADIVRFQEEFRQKAAGLVGGSGSLPPGHPLDSGRRLVNSLMAENDKLQKENQDLRKQLSKMERGRDPTR